MHLIKISIITFLFLILLMSCSEKEIEEKLFIIKYGSECGWCAGQEYITVSETKVEYERNIPCGDEKGITNKSKNLNAEEWEEISSSFDYSLFKTLKYNTCNVCVDGCDEIIRITENESSHELRYSVSDKLEGMENLREILSELLIEMRDTN